MMDIKSYWSRGNSKKDIVMNANQINQPVGAFQSELITLESP